MDKKVYIKPEMEIAEMVSDVIMTGGSLGLHGDEPVDTTTGQLGHGRRGSWGDLWSEGE